jgi:uncharacterized protein YkwD
MPVLIDLNWIDWLIICILLFAVVEGWRLGFIHLIASFSAFILSVFVISRYHNQFASWLASNFGISLVWAESVEIFFLILITQVIFTELFIKISGKFAAKIMASRIDNILGSILGLGNAIFSISFVLYLMLLIHIFPSVSGDISRSKLTQQINIYSEKYLHNLKLPIGLISQTDNDVLIDENDQILKYLTIKPQRWDLVADTLSEMRLIQLINSDRQKNGLGILTEDPNLTQIAYDQCFDMFERSYFSQTDPDGSNLEKRLIVAGLNYSGAIENLGFGPDYLSVHTKFMNSQKHRQIILSPKFKTIGVGIVDGGNLGQMVTEIFIK